MKSYKDSTLTPRQRAELLLKELTLEEKFGQINCYFYQPTAKSPEEEFPYGVGVVSALEMRAHERLEQSVSLQRDLQERIIKLSPHGIPAIFHMEGICGLFLQDAVSFPAPLGRGASFDAKLEGEIGKTIGAQAGACGISHVFAPVLDIAREPRFGRMNESYGEDETLVAMMGTSFVNGLQSNKGVEAVAKHFLAFHQGAGGLHGADVSMGERELREVYAKPFEAAISQAGLKGVMPCYNFVNGELVSFSKRYLTDLLRMQLGFDGLAVSDYCAISNGVEVNRVAEDACTAGYRALSAGMDVEQQFPYGYGKKLMEKFASGEADLKILDAAVLRVLEAKFRMGLFERPFALSEPEECLDFKREKAEKLSLRSATESLVLLKNDGILPLSADHKKIAVVGYHGGTIRGMFGGYTHLSMVEGLIGAMGTMAGVDGGKREEALPSYPGCKVLREEKWRNTFDKLARHIHPQTKTLAEELRTALPEADILYAYGYDYAGTDESGFSQALKLCSDADVILLTLGGKNGTGAMNTMGENINCTSIGLPPAQERFIEEVAKLKKPLIGLHFDGRPISSDAADKYLNALIECWLPSEKGSEAVVSVLLGKECPSGKLPVSVAHCAGQLPMYYSHPFGSSYHSNDYYGDYAYIDSPRTPRYSFGFGLSYTKFSYSDLCIDRQEIEAGEVFTVSLQIENTGTCDGTEIVQLYCTDLCCSVARPNRSLCGFARVFLPVGSKKRITFIINCNQFAFLDENMRWKVERGPIELFAASSSAEEGLSGKIYIARDAYISEKDRFFFAKTVEK